MIRTLLIDHRDSFTQNLAHDLATVFGSFPVIVEHDDPTLTLETLDGFDCVVLSPGPGHPGEPADFGFGLRVLQESTLPVLGICLGHQGLAVAHGGRVARAPEPVHGRVDQIHHDGTGVFTSLPSPLQAVRYHSLAVTHVPDVLRVTARSADGVVMGLEHRTLPQWGVQFHPESICSEHGRDLLSRFRDEVVARIQGADLDAYPEPNQESQPKTAQVSTSASDQAARRGLVVDGLATAQPDPRILDHATRAPGTHRTEHHLHVRAFSTSLSDETLFQTLFGDDDKAVWLDSHEAGANARFSIMGSGDTLALSDVETGTVTLRSGGGAKTKQTRTEQRGFFDWLESDQTRRCLTGGSLALHGSAAEELDEAGLADALPFSFRPGWVGYLGYELKGQLGSRNRHRSDLPDAALLFVTRSVVLDHQTGTTYLLQLDERDWLGAAQRTLDEAALKAAGEQEPSRAVGHKAAGSEAPGFQAVGFGGTVRAREDHDAYVAGVAAAQELIAAGETYELCLTTQLTVSHGTNEDGTNDGSPDPWETYLRLRAQAPAPFGAYLRVPATEDIPALAVLSTSPERFLRVDADGRAESSPIKGTRPRGATEQEDHALREDLATHPKDRAENLMIADLVRHDLGATAVIGSVRVEELFGVHTFSRAHQMITTVSSRLLPGVSSVTCLREAFPPGSMTGAPKHRTMELIDALESGPRGIYSGAIGWFGVDGALDTSVVIRTVVMVNGELRYGTGGAVVALSDPEDEYQETMVKAGPLLSLLSSLGEDGLSESREGTA